MPKQQHNNNNNNKWSVTSMVMAGLLIAMFGLNSFVDKQRMGVHLQRLLEATTSNNTSLRGSDSNYPPQSLPYQPHYLEGLMYKYGSDKSHDDHSYTDVYQMLWDTIREDVQQVMEVGIAAGQSLQAWYHYFPRAQIRGYDVTWNPRVQPILDQLGDRVNVTITDLLTVDDLGRDMDLHPDSVDIIIEDAMHTPTQQQDLILKLFPLVKPGGFYVIEDVNLSLEEAKIFREGQEDQLRPQVRDIFQTHDAMFIDASLGHRSWNEWARRQGKHWVQDRVRHNSHLIVIRKRKVPLPPVKMNFGKVAMNIVTLDQDVNNPLPELNTR